MAGDELRIGIIGAGQITRTRHLPGFRKLSGVRIAGVCNRHRDSAARVAREFDIPRIYANWEEMIQDREIDAVVIGAWPYLHCPVTLAALDAGKHVLTQARMAMNAREAQRMLDKAREYPEPHGDDRAQPLWADRRDVPPLADRRRLSRHLARASRPGFFERPGRPGEPNELAADDPLLGVQHADPGDSLRDGSPLGRPGQPGSGLRVEDDHRAARSRAGESYASGHARQRSGFDDPGRRFLRSLSLERSRLARPGDVGGPLWQRGHPDLRSARRRDPRRHGDADQGLQVLPIPEEAKGGWRVEEEFVASIRGERPVTHTDFETGVRYMQFTEAVARSSRHQVPVTLPLKEFSNPSL